jgi:hypothetical protein
VLRQHGGTLVPLSPEGDLLPTLQPRPVTMCRNLATEAAAAAESPGNPILLSDTQSDNLSEYIVRDSSRLLDVGFEQLVAERRKCSNFHPGVKALNHKAARLLDHLHKRGASVTLSSPPWDEVHLESTIQRGPRKSATEYVDFLCEELLDFVQKGFWMVLPVKLLRTYKTLYKRLRVSPMGVVPQ